MPKIVFAAASVALGPPETRLRLTKNDPYWADSAEVLEHPDCFTEVPTNVRGTRPPQPEVEQATAAPGEKRRGLRRSDLPSGDRD